VGALSACASGGGGGDDKVEKGEKSKDNPLAVNKDAQLEVVIFNGGYGDQYAKDAHKVYEARFGKVKHSRTQKIRTKLQPRILKGNPPDVINNSGADDINIPKLVNNKQVPDVTELLDAPSWDDPSVPVRDILIPGTIEQGTFDRPYELNYAFTVFGVWYNRILFEANGWEPPQTWDDMLALCADMQAQGVAPWAYPGTNAPRYMHWPLLIMAAKEAGPEVLADLDNLVEGAWQHEAIVESADKLAGLRRDGYFLDGTEGMSHIQSQVQWAMGNAGMITSGTWLENEVANSFTDSDMQEEWEIDPDAEPEADFEFAMFTFPSISANAAMPPETLFARAGEPYIIPEDAAHKEAGMEYMRAMLSAEGARGFTETVTSLTSLLGAADDIEFEAPGLNSAAEALSAAGTNVLNYRWDGWYPSMNNPDIDALTGDLLRGDIDAQEWADGAEAVAQGIRDDDDIEKYTR
jgi:N-acetylglucosamine transport system substrate-binding protein